MIVIEKMEFNEMKYLPIEGKTYSLFGDNNSTIDYYNNIRTLCDRILEKEKLTIVLDTIQKYSSHNRYLRRILKNSDNSLISFCLNEINSPLKPYTEKTKEHLKNLSPFNIWDKRLATTEEQYHLNMLEIELTNRLNRILFLNADKKISLQPYCLQDFSVNCKSANVGFDNQCKHCSKNCFQNHASNILKANGVEPYIWMGASIKNAAKDAYENNQSFGILGIACIPELIWGMRKCRKYNIPVVGIPLNANRCVRWFGAFHQNSIDLNELETLVKS